MNHLIRKYPKAKYLELTEKDIIYFCRDGLSSYNNDTENKKNLELDLLEIIKAKEWDWNHSDIDGNTILTYPLQNNSYSIAEYLIENKKYNINTYNSNTSQSLCSCVNLIAHEVFEYINNKSDLHKLYRNDMLIRAYQFASRIDNKEYSQSYLKKANKILEKETFFPPVLGDFASLHTNYRHRGVSLFHFLENHPLNPEDKLNALNEYVEQSKKISYQLPEEFTFVVEKWMLKHQLSNKLETPNSTNKKIKI